VKENAGRDWNRDWGAPSETFAGSQIGGESFRGPARRSSSWTVLCFSWDGKCCLQYPLVREKPQVTWCEAWPGVIWSYLVVRGLGGKCVLLIVRLHLIPHHPTAGEFMCSVLLTFCVVPLGEK